MKGILPTDFKCSIRNAFTQQLHDQHKWVEQLSEGELVERQGMSGTQTRMEPKKFSIF